MNSDKFSYGIGDRPTIMDARATDYEDVIKEAKAACRHHHDKEHTVLIPWAVYRDGRKIAFGMALIDPPIPDCRKTASHDWMHLHNGSDFRVTVVYVCRHCGTEMTVEENHVYDNGIVLPYVEFMQIGRSDARQPTRHSMEDLWSCFRELVGRIGDMETKHEQRPDPAAFEREIISIKKEMASIRSILGSEYAGDMARVATPEGHVTGAQAISSGLDALQELMADVRKTVNARHYA